MFRILSVAVALVGLGIAPSALAADYVLRQVQPSTGSNVRKVLLRSAIPFDKSWSQLSPAEQQVVRDNYDGLPVDAEPPFPLDGLIPVIREMERIEKYADTGTLLIVVDVDAAGEATDGRTLATPDSAMASALLRVAMQMKYKPGRKDGQPAAMKFPLRFEVGPDVGK
jgi:hypothetical protein